LIGRAAMALGAGRDKVDDVIDPAVGAVLKVKRGDAVRAGDALIELHYREAGRLEAALGLLRQACQIGPELPAAQPLILGSIE
jgi:pyrimidine-nucleoside phosphorylase